jgi:hypothetical protein
MSGVIIQPGQAREMETTDAGLVVPKGTIQKPRQRWTWEDWKKIDRGIKTLATGGNIVAVLLCMGCSSKFTATQTDRGFEMECKCRVHEIIRR